MEPAMGRNFGVLSSRRVVFFSIRPDYVAFVVTKWTFFGAQLDRKLSSYAPTCFGGQVEEDAA
jgi:hypothetical protein